MRPTLLARVLMAFLTVPTSAAAQSRTFELAGQLTIAAPFGSDEVDIGIGARAAARMTSLVGVEAEQHFGAYGLPHRSDNRLVLFRQIFPNL